MERIGKDYTILIFGNVTIIFYSLRSHFRQLPKHLFGYVSKSGCVWSEWKILNCILKNRCLPSYNCIYGRIKCHYSKFNLLRFTIVDCGHFNYRRWIELNFYLVSEPKKSTQNKDINPIKCYIRTENDGPKNWKSLWIAHVYCQEQFRRWWQFVMLPSW